MSAHQPCPDADVRRARIARTLPVIGAAALLWCAHAVADEANASADEDSRCDFRPPQPALLASAYTDYRSGKPRGDNVPPQRLIEHATLADGTRLSVISDACVDSFGSEFRFTFAAAKHAAKDTAFWADAARHALSHLRTTEPGSREIPELLEFLARAPNLHRHGARIVQCHDRTQPEDGDCDFASGGTYLLGIERKGEAVEVSVGSASSG